MKKKLIIDLIMFILMLILMFYNLTGGLYHEILGIILFIIYIVHIGLNYKVIKNMGAKIIKGEALPLKMTLGFILDTIMFLCLIILMISGIFISKFIFSFNGGEIWVSLHNLSAYALFGSIVAHILLHLKIISKFIANKFDIDETVINILMLIMISGSTLMVYYHLITEKKEENKNNNTQVNDNSSSNGGTTNSSGGNTPTLTEYLASKHCSGCHNHCILTAIKCSIGASAKESATSEYYATYGTTTSTTSNTNSLSNEYSDGNVTYTVDIK